MGLGLLPVEGQSLVLAGALISIALNPVAFAAVEPLQRWMRERSALARSLERPMDPLAELPSATEQRYLSGQVVLVGYGRVGRRIAGMLAERGVPFVVAEQNREIVEQLRAEGLAAVSGDASDPMVLVQAHVAQAGMLVVATDDPFGARQMIDIARTLNPRIRAAVLALSDEEADLLAVVEGCTVFQYGEELARSMGRHVLERYGKLA